MSKNKYHHGDLRNPSNGNNQWTRTKRIQVHHIPQSTQDPKRPTKNSKTDHEWQSSSFPHSSCHTVRSAFIKHITTLYAYILYSLRTTQTSINFINNMYTFFLNAMRESFWVYWWKGELISSAELYREKSRKSFAPKKFKRPKMLLFSTDWHSLSSDPTNNLQLWCSHRPSDLH